MMQFDLSSARGAASRNTIERWVHDYLRGPGRNEAFAAGLALRQRFWRGPILVPFRQLRRKCGPEPGMLFPVIAESWEKRISDIIATFGSIEAFPPLIVEYRNGELIVCDGNHRLGAFSAMGVSACWVILWYPDEFEKAHHDLHVAIAKDPTE